MHRSKVCVTMIFFLLFVQGQLQVDDAQDILTCVNLFQYHSPKLMAAYALSQQESRFFVLNYMWLCKEHLHYSDDYTKYVTYLGGVATPLFPQEQYLSLKLA